MKRIITYFSDLLDDNSQTVVSAHTTDHSRTPSPQKSIPSNAQSTVIKSPSPVQQSSLNIFAPKPYRSTIDLPTSQEQVGISYLLFLSLLHIPPKLQEMSFSRKELLTLMVII